MISSVPYVPPDTMKNVAATSGQSVSFAALFFAVGIAREGGWVGSDKELNFYSRSPGRNSLAPLRSTALQSHSKLKRVRIRRIQESPLHATKKCAPARIFSVSPIVLSYYPSVQCRGALHCALSSLRPQRPQCPLC